MTWNAEERAAVLAATPPAGEFIPFDGDDFCENCRGWDGESHRCDCGNRRLYWEFDRFDGRLHARPQVY